ncbi:MAG: SCO family protein [Planctomycetota bacterium]
MSRLIGLFVLCALASCDGSPGRGGAIGQPTVLAQAPSSTEVLGQVAEFSLTERSGATVTNETLAGEPYVASFFFARCSGPCPALLGNVRRMQDDLEGTPARLVSITVDPKNDTPEALRTLADNFTADSERWLFLTGEEDKITKLMRLSFALALAKMPSTKTASDAALAIDITHDTKLVVVDGKGQVRGYYDGEDLDEVAAATARVRWLAENE